MLDEFEPPFAVQQELERAHRDWGSRFGLASRLQLGLAYSTALSTRPRFDDSYASNARREIEDRHVALYGGRALAAEWTDEGERDRAVGSDRALVAYEAKWNKRLLRLAHKYPARWRVPGLSDDEVIDALTLRLLEVIRTAPCVQDEFCRVGREWGLVVASQELQRLRQRFRLEATTMDFRELDPPERALTHEQQWIEREDQLRRQRVAELAHTNLNQAQRRWLCAMESAFDAGEVFVRSERINLTAASRTLGKNRSSAQRAFRSLQCHFQRERDRSE